VSGGDEPFEAIIKTISLLVHILAQQMCLSVQRWTINDLKGESSNSTVPDYFKLRIFLPEILAGKGEPNSRNG
jgi:hypothetical protein